MFQQDVLTRIINVQWGGAQPTAIGVSRNSPTAGTVGSFGPTTVLIVFKPDGTEIFRVTGNYNHPESAAIGPQDRIGAGIVLWPPATEEEPTDIKAAIIRSYTKAGVLEWEVSVPSDDVSASVPSMAFDGDGNLVVAKHTASSGAEIVKYSPAGGEIWSVSRPFVSKVSLDPWGNVASIGGSTPEVSLLSPAGVERWSVSGGIPRDVVCDGNGNVWAMRADDTLIKYNHFGAPVLSLGLTTNSTLKSIDADEKKQIWVKVEGAVALTATAHGFDQDSVPIGTVTFPTPQQPLGVSDTSGSQISAASNDLAWCAGFSDISEAGNSFAGWCYRVNKTTGQVRLSFQSADFIPSGPPPTPLSTALRGRCIAKRYVGKKSAESEPVP